MAGTWSARSVARIDATPSAFAPASKVSATTFADVGIRPITRPSNAAGSPVDVGGALSDGERVADVVLLGTLVLGGDEMTLARLDAVAVLDDDSAGTSLDDAPVTDPVGKADWLLCAWDGPEPHAATMPIASIDDATIKGGVAVTYRRFQLGYGRTRDESPAPAADEWLN